MTEVMYVGHVVPSQFKYKIAGEGYFTLEIREKNQVFDVRPNHASVLFDSGRFAKPDGEIPKTEKKEKPKTSTDDLRERFFEMSMKELRDFVKNNNLKAKDTKKEELIEEIINEMEGR